MVNVDACDLAGKIGAGEAPSRLPLAVILPDAAVVAALRSGEAAIARWLVWLAVEEHRQRSAGRRVVMASAAHVAADFAGRVKPWSSQLPPSAAARVKRPGWSERTLTRTRAEFVARCAVDCGGGFLRLKRSKRWHALPVEVAERLLYEADGEALRAALALLVPLQAARLRGREGATTYDRTIARVTGAGASRVSRAVRGLRKLQVIGDNRPGRELVTGEDGTRRHPARVVAVASALCPLGRGAFALAWAPGAPSRAGPLSGVRGHAKMDTELRSAETVNETENQLPALPAAAGAEAPSARLDLDAAPVRPDDGARLRPALVRVVLREAWGDDGASGAAWAIRAIARAVPSVGVLRGLLRREGRPDGVLNPTAWLAAVVRGEREAIAAGTFGGSWRATGAGPKGAERRAPAARTPGTREREAVAELTGEELRAALQAGAWLRAALRLAELASGDGAGVRLEAAASLVARAEAAGVPVVGLHAAREVVHGAREAAARVESARERASLARAIERAAGGAWSRALGAAGVDAYDRAHWLGGLVPRLRPRAGAGELVAPDESHARWVCEHGLAVPVVAALAAETGRAWCLQVVTPEGRPIGVVASAAVAVESPEAGAVGVHTPSGGSLEEPPSVAEVAERAVATVASARPGGAREAARAALEAIAARHRRGGGRS